TSFAGAGSASSPRNGAESATPVTSWMTEPHSIAGLIRSGRKKYCTTAPPSNTANPIRCAYRSTSLRISTADQPTRPGFPAGFSRAPLLVLSPQLGPPAEDHPRHTGALLQHNSHAGRPTDSPGQPACACVLNLSAILI